MGGEWGGGGVWGVWRCEVDMTKEEFFKAIRSALRCDFGGPWEDSELVDLVRAMRVGHDDMQERDRETERKLAVLRAQLSPERVREHLSSMEECFKGLVWHPAEKQWEPLILAFTQGYVGALLRNIRALLG